MTQKRLESDTVDEALSLLDKYWAERGYFRHFTNSRTIDEVLSLLNEHAEEARIIAGGTDTVSLMKNKVIMPKVMISLKAMPELSYITEDTEGLKIGALTGIKDIETSAIVARNYNLLIQAAHSVASPHIRNMATVAGNLCQDVRCWYYRRSPITGISFFCRRKGGELCYAKDGDNRHHSIMGGYGCFAVCPSDMAPALIALEASVKIVSLTGDRIIPLDEFFTISGNVLKPYEIITEIQVPTPKHSIKQQYSKFRVRKVIDFAISSVAVAINTEDGVVTDSRIVLGGVATFPYRATRAEEFILGKAITASIAEKSAEALVSEAVPLSMNAYKVPITEALVKRAILDC